jgi:tetratricopeptide (TPR) repeat protein
MVFVSPVASAPQTAAAGGISVESSAQLFSVMCALDAGGLDVNPSMSSNAADWAALHDRLRHMQGPATEALRQFYREHALADPGETMSRFISFALVVGPPPNFTYQIDHDVLPPDVLSIENFDQILRNFYKEAQLSAEWARMSKDYDREVGRYDSPVRLTTFLTSAYLREVQRPSNGREFTVVVEPLVGNRLNFRTYQDHYSIVVGSGAELPIDDIRHAYIHFLVDPMVLRSRQELDKKSALLSIAAKAPLLPRAYREDFFGLFDECFVKAVELRLNRLSAADLESALAEDDGEGLILVRPLVAQLKLFEKDGPAMQYYFPDIVKNLDVDAEKQRLQNVKFATAESAKPKTDEKAAAPPESSLDHDLAEGDRQIALKNGTAAEAIFTAVLASHADLPRAEYGLAIASILQGKGDRAQELFEKVVANAKRGTAVEPSILAWSYVYLGRILDMRGDRDLALTEYSAALAIADAPDTARAAAQRGQTSPYNPSGGGGGSGEAKPPSQP